MRLPPSVFERGLRPRNPWGEVRKGGGAPLRGSGMGEHVVMIYGSDRS